MGNFPMRLRWNYRHRMISARHELLPGQSSPARVAQGDADRAGGARCLDDPRHVMVFVIIYFVTMVVMVGGFDWRMLPFIAGW